jgi:PST family polysaccharide transporter
MLILAPELVELLLGSQWSQVSVIFQLLGLSALCQPITNTSGWLYIATGRTDRMFRWGIFSSSLLVMSFIIGLPYGVMGVALSYSIAKLIQTLPCMYYATRNTAITLLDLLNAVKQPFLASFLAGLVAFGIKVLIEPTLTVWAIVVISSAAMGLIYIASLFYLFGAKDFYVSVIRQLKRS